MSQFQTTFFQKCDFTYFLNQTPTYIHYVCVYACAVNTTETFMHIACDIQVDDRFEFSQRC